MTVVSYNLTSELTILLDFGVFEAAKKFIISVLTIVLRRGRRSRIRLRFGRPLFGKFSANRPYSGELESLR
jgi:hypothetical protein